MHRLINIEGIRRNPTSSCYRDWAMFYRCVGMYKNSKHPGSNNFVTNWKDTPEEFRIWDEPFLLKPVVSNQRSAAPSSCPHFDT